jgi:hypothetical protein
MEKILKKLENGEDLTTGDFDKLGYSFESFLRYAQVSKATRKNFHESVITTINWKLKNA